MNKASLCRRALVAAGAVVVAGSLTTVGTAQAALRYSMPRHPASVRVGGTAAPITRHAAAIGAASTKQSSNVQVWLEPDTASATDSAYAVSTPGSGKFHQYLSPADYTRKFAASAGTAEAVADWLRAKGYRNVSVDKQRSFVRASGTVGTSQSAFSVKLRRYTVRDGVGRQQSIIANDRDIALPAGIAKDVVGVTGLDNVQPQTSQSQHPRKHLVTASGCSKYYGQKTRSGLPSYHRSTRFPTAICGYTGKQLRTAYGMNSTNVGSGQTVAYVEIGTPYKMLDTLKHWAKTNKLIAPHTATYSQKVLGRGNHCGNPFDIEEQLDIEAGYAMAPGQHQLLIGGDGCATKLEGAQALFDADLTVLDGNGSKPLASIVSNSWELGDEATPAVYSKVMHSLLLRAANEGVGMYFSSGDAPGVQIPADDPLATSVGGTSLGLDKNNYRLFETGWSNKFLAIDQRRKRYIDEAIGRSAAGGGTSTLWKQPEYQAGVVPASMSSARAGDLSNLRAGPDISALADPYTGMNQGVLFRDGGRDHFASFADGGTSLAAPMVAGMVAAAQQGQPSNFGFLNPVLYKLAGSSALRDPLPVTNSTPVRYRAVFCPSSNDLCGEDSLQTFDSQAHAYTDQITASGFDTMTGLGTPNGQAFLAALRSH